MSALNASRQCGQEDVFGFAGGSILETCDPSKHSACRACGTESLPARGSSDVAESEHDPRTWTNAVLRVFQRCAARKERCAVKSLSTVPAGWSMPSRTCSWFTSSSTTTECQQVRVRCLTGSAGSRFERSRSWMHGFSPQIGCKRLGGSES